MKKTLVALAILGTFLAASAHAQEPRDLTEVNSWVGATLRPLVPSSPSPVSGSIVAVHKSP
jgi:hypothetical protein